MKISFLRAIAVIVLVGCNKTNEPDSPPLSLEEVKAQVSGRYQGRYANGKEYFEIRSDGTFSQTFVQNGATNYAAEGKWSFKKSVDVYRVTFNPFVDLRNAILSGASPEKGNGWEATFYEDELRINFIPDLAYYIVKMKSIEAGTNKVVK